MIFMDWIAKKDEIEEFLRKLNSFDNKNRFLMEPEITKDEIRKYLEESRKAASYYFRIRNRIF